MKECSGATDEDVTWYPTLSRKPSLIALTLEIYSPSCQIVFRRISEQFNDLKGQGQESKAFGGGAELKMHPTANSGEVSRQFKATNGEYPSAKRKRETDMDEELAWYRRVRIRKRIPPLYDLLERLLDNVQNHASGWPLLSPVNRGEVPEYYKVYGFRDHEGEAREWYVPYARGLLQGREDGVYQFPLI